MIQLPPKQQAQQDYRNGEGQERNPFPKGTDDHYTYAMEMHRLQLEELREIEAELHGHH
jgi:hypothetical protein